MATRNAGARAPGPGSRLTLTAAPTPPSTGKAVVNLRRFGEPSTYSLAPAELAAHIRQLRRSGWQSWEVRVRFDYRSAA
jgi:hypothetical protein